ncbi:MAG TPA: hypothetical protein VGR72_02510 [Candidatus Acidoferrales bacterium]|nr:hypothetical protein [Candidatus Acidoferrales bacterium]
MTRLAGKASARQLIAIRAALIENEMRSREESSHCSQSTYQFLIENEFHCAKSTFQSFQSHKLLELLLSDRKSSTSQFLIDNFGDLFVPLVPSALAINFMPLRSNRPSPRLEMPVNHRKQKAEASSNRPQIAIRNLCAVSALSLTNSNRADRIPPPFCFNENGNLRERGE